MAIRWLSKSLDLFGLLALLVTSSANSGRKSIYYQSQKDADIALAAFDRANPDCQLWTNWQKMCSRTGDDGSTYCQKASVNSRPSVAFCTARTNEPYDGLVKPYTSEQYSSYIRFCLVDGQPLQNSNDIDRCRWSIDRPFNGLRLFERNHAWCKRWVPAVPISGNRKLSQTIGLYCATRAIPSWCNWAEGMAYGLQEEPLTGRDRNDVVGVILDPSSIAINGIFCRRITTDARQ